MLNEKLVKLISDISAGENLDKDYLLNKYLNTEKISTDDNNEIKNTLDRIIINGNRYYCNNLDGSDFIDTKGVVCGKYINGNYLFNE